MPIYDYRCACGWTGELWGVIGERDNMACPRCARPLERLLAAPMGKMAGQVAKGGGADRFTADMLGIPLKELPASLRTPETCDS